MSCTRGHIGPIPYSVPACDLCLTQTKPLREVHLAGAAVRLCAGCTVRIFPSLAPPRPGVSRQAAKASTRTRHVAG